MSNDGLTTIHGHHSVGKTIDRLADRAGSAGLQVFARIDHAEGAEEVGMPLRPTQLLIFGNPRGGTPLMQERQTAGIDLPLKALAWEDADAQVWLTYNEPAWLVQRHRLSSATAGSIEALATGLAKLAGAATAA